MLLLMSKRSCVHSIGKPSDYMCIEVYAHSFIVDYVVVTGIGNVITFKSL